MIVILQKYILRELLRAFAMTAVALTCMMAFGGGLMDLMNAKGITANEMLKIMMYMLPIVMAYSLPVSALFSTTIVYGRLAASNEIDACRASGVNIFKLMGPAVLLSIAVSVTTFELENDMMPRLMNKIEALVKRDMQTLATQELKRKGFVSYMKFAMHCEQVDGSVQPDIDRKGKQNSPGYIQLGKVAFVRNEGGTPSFFGTAKTAQVLFDHRDDGLAISVNLNQVRAYDAAKGQMVDMEFLPLDRPVRVPALTRKRVKFLSLEDLVATKDEPALFNDARNAIRTACMELMKGAAYESLGNMRRRQGFCQLSDASGNTYVLEADLFQQFDTDGHFELSGVKVVRKDKNGTRTFLAKKGSIHAAATGGGVIIHVPKDGRPASLAWNADALPVFNVSLNSVKVAELGDSERQSISLNGLLSPRSVLDQVRPVTLQSLLDEQTPIKYTGRFSDRRLQAIDDYEMVRRKCSAELHTRIVYSLSSLVLLVMGAALGTMFRGGHFVSAFALSFIPLMIVVIMLLLGKRMSEVTDPAIGAAVIWSGLIAVALADVVILGKFLKR